MEVKGNGVGSDPRDGPAGSAAGTLVCARHRVSVAVLKQFARRQLHRPAGHRHRTATALPLIQLASPPARPCLIKQEYGMKLYHASQLYEYILFFFFSS